MSVVMWWALVTLSVMTIVVVPPSSGCSCFYRHPQQHVCEADFVLFARIRRVTQTSNGLVAYKVKVKRIMKASEKVKLILEKGLIYTIPGTCELKLEKRTSHVITGNVEGGKPWTNICHFSEPWRNLSSKMKKGFKLLYARGCDCPIMSCSHWDKCPKASFFCAWETSNEANDCQGRHAVCLRGADGACDWLGGRQYRSCMKPRRHPITGNDIDIYSKRNSPKTMIAIANPQNNDVINNPQTNAVVDTPQNNVINNPQTNNDVDTPQNNVINNPQTNNAVDDPQDINDIDRNLNSIQHRRRPFRRIGYKGPRVYKGKRPKHRLRRPYGHRLGHVGMSYEAKQG